MAKTRNDGGSRAEDMAIQPIDIHLGGRIRFRRNQVGLTATQLSEKIGLTRQAVERYEKAQQRLPASRLFDIAVILEVDPGWFFQDCPHISIPDGVPEAGPENLSPAGVDLVTRFERLAPEQRRAVTLVVAAMDEALAARQAEEMAA